MSFFFLLQDQRTGGQNRSSLGGGEEVGYVNGRMILVEITSGIGGRWIKENDGGGEFKYDIFNIL
jgi:hypothetical protein